MEAQSNPPLQKEKPQSRGILEMTASEARAFFLKGSTYSDVSLPQYIEFEPLIHQVSGYLGSRRLTDLYGGGKPEEFEGVNYRFFSNRDGKYAWRPYQFIHPALYVSLAHRITEPDHWETITKRFATYSEDSRIRCVSLPVESLGKGTDKAAMVSRWYDKTEQESIKLALDYEYVFHTDVTDCYGSIYTHSVAWALHGRAIAKAERNNKQLIGNVIDYHLRAMANGQTNGIPQGCKFMDFIAEMILGYADLELSQRLETPDGTPPVQFQILRYRDDYRIFVHDPQVGEHVLKVISEVLSELGMKLGPQKTSYSSEVIKHSIKEDKRYWTEHKRVERGLQKQLMLIHSLAQKYPNSGSLVRALTEYLRRLERVKAPKSDVVVLISILVDIMFRNPRTYPVAAAILSKLISCHGDISDRFAMIEKVKRRFESIPNTGHLDLWLQRITYYCDLDIGYAEPLCHVVAGTDTKIWNSDWLNDSTRSMIDPRAIVNRKKLNELTYVIGHEEVEMFPEYEGT